MERAFTGNRIKNAAFKLFMNGIDGFVRHAKSTLKTEDEQERQK